MSKVFIKFLIFLPAVIFFVTSCASQKDIISLNSQLRSLYRQTRRDEKKVEKSIKELQEAIEASEARQKELQEVIEASEARHKETERIFKEAIEASEARQKELQEVIEASEARQKELQEVIEASEARHKETERIFKEDQESLRLDLAQLGADLVGIRDSIQGLTGRVEESGHLLKSTIEEDTTKEDAIVSQMKELSLMTEDLKSRMQNLEDYVSSEIAVSMEKAGSEEASPTQEIEKNDSSYPQKKELTGPEIYDRTLGYYKDGQYEKAIADFKSFLKSYPKSDLADNAHFWIGECHRAQRRYEEAILAYQKVINGYPKGNKVPSAMLHQGFAFEKINDKTTANLLFKKLLKSFPKTKEAEVASKRLSKK